MTQGTKIGLTLVSALALTAGCSNENRTVTLLGDSVPAGGRWTELFNGRDLGGWKALNPSDSKWMTASRVTLDDTDPTKFEVIPGSGILVNGPSGSPGKTSNLLTLLEHGDCEAHIEFMVPSNSNSGVYFQGRYEIQILDSFNKPEVTFSDAGGIYARWINEQNVEGHAPRVNASRQPGEWQTIEAKFTAPRFDESGKKIANARFDWVRLNGVLIHENVELNGPTRAALDENQEVPAGPLMLQGDHGPVAYRNLRIRLLDAQETP